jgi:hypothetical protein
MGVVRLLFMVSTVTALVSWGVLGFVDLYIVAAMALGSLVLATLVGGLMHGSQSVTYGIFFNQGQAEGGYLVAQLKPTSKVSREDKSYMLEGVIKQGGIPVDSIGMFFLNRGLIKLGLAFTVRPGPISDEYRASRAAEENERDQNGRTLKGAIEEFHKNRKE